MLTDVLSLAEQDTNLRKVAVNEYAGPCPACYGNDRFRVRYSSDKGTWIFMCRGCYDAQQFLPEKDRKRGWGDAIDYLRHYRKMSFLDAKAMVGGQEIPSEHRSQPVQRYLTEEWQKTIGDTMKLHIERMWDTNDTLALDYARSRGFFDETIKQFQFGYSIRKGIPYLVIPSINEGRYVTVYCRDLRPDVSHDERWRDVPGGTKREVYLADGLYLRPELPVVLCEDALSAISIWQECGDLVNVVATGGADCGMQAKWVARLACAPVVLVSLDADGEGDKHSKEWLDRLKNGRRLRPLLKDANDMLMDNWDLRQWVIEGLSADDQKGIETPVETDIAEECCVCHVEITNPCYDFSYDPIGNLYCNRHLPALA